jgi:hypothetical protein
MTERYKLSPSAINCFMDSPKQYYWRYIQKLEPLLPSMGNFDHDKLAGTLWSDFVDRFYKEKMDEDQNMHIMFSEWKEMTAGWVTDKVSSRFMEAMQCWSSLYYNLYHPDDGCRNGSEKYVENDRFQGYLDGLSHDGIIHEVKSTSRSRQISEQLWKVQNSLQVKLYSVLTDAKGIRIEFAWKDSPYGIYRSDVLPVTDKQKASWESELNSIADHIFSLGDNPDNYVCHPDGCCMVSKGFVRMCSYQVLCQDGLTEENRIAFKEKVNRRK